MGERKDGPPLRAGILQEKFKNVQKKIDAFTQSKTCTYATYVDPNIKNDRNDQNSNRERGDDCLAVYAPSVFFLSHHGSGSWFFS